MAFLEQGKAFPPEDWAYLFRKFYEWQAWYSGDPDQLLALYSSSLYHPIDTDRGLFWARIEAEERAEVNHMPLAGDIAETSSNLLFSESPEIIYDPSGRSGERIRTFIKENGLLNILLEGAELSAALGGVFLKLNTDPDLVKIPILSIVTPLQAIPKFNQGRLQEILFFRTVREEHNGEVVWRLFENRRRENGQLLIEYRLNKGYRDRLGRNMDMKAIDETAKLNLEDTTYDIDGLGCVYVPNKRPNRLIPGSAVGMNDYAGCITLLDSLDFAWTGWMRELELGMAQILVDETLLENVEGKRMFNKFQKAFVRLNMSSYQMSGENVKPIEQVQFDLRVDEYSKTCTELFQQIVSQSGYSPQSFGYEVYGRAESGTALRIRERKSHMTREKKGRYWEPALWELFWQMQQIDISSGLSSMYELQEVNVVLQDSIITDEKERSETLRNIDQAKAISTYTKVKMLHPDWEDEDIEAEVKRIMDDQGLGVMPFEGEV